MEADIYFLEFLEVVIYQFLYLRAIYPSQIFRKQKVMRLIRLIFSNLHISLLQAFGLPVHISIYPPLNNYIRSALQEMMTLLNDNRLNKLELRLHNKDEIFERLVVSIDQSVSYDDIENVFWDEFRSYLHSLDAQCKTLEKPSKESQFRIFLHAKAYSFSNETTDVVRT